MSAATAAAPAAPQKPEEQMADLLTHLAGKGAVQINKMPERLKGAQLLSKALIKGYIEIGQRQYAIVSPEVQVKVDKDGKQSIHKTYEAHVSDEWTWTNLKGPKHKQLWELMEEDIPEGCELHVKLTAEGMAETA
jgi:hypothetical protein